MGTTIVDPDGLQVRKPAALGLIHCVADVVARHRTLTTNVASLGHNRRIVSRERNPAQWLQPRSTGSPSASSLRPGRSSCGNTAASSTTSTFSPVPDGDTGSNMYLTARAALNQAASVAGRDAPGGCGRRRPRQSARGAGQFGRDPLVDAARVCARGPAPGRDRRAAACRRHEGRGGRGPGARCPIRSRVRSSPWLRRRPTPATPKRFAKPTCTGSSAQWCGPRTTRSSERPSSSPALREAGVVDSGGAGFCYFIEGALRFLPASTQRATRLPPAGRAFEGVQRGARGGRIPLLHRIRARRCRSPSRSPCAMRSLRSATR